MNLKELIFGGGVKVAGGAGGAYRDSIQAWLPVKNIIGGVIVTKDNRFVKVCEVLPVNFYLKSPADQENIILSFAAYDDAAFAIGDKVIVTVQRYDFSKKQIYGKIVAKW